MLVDDFLDDVEAIVADRLRMLDALGMTEHEWACAGGERFPAFRRPSVSDLQFEEDDMVIGASPSGGVTAGAGEAAGSGSQLAPAVDGGSVSLPPPPPLPPAPPPRELPPPPPPWVCWPVAWKGSRDAFATDPGWEWLREVMLVEGAAERFGEYHLVTESAAVYLTDVECAVLENPAMPGEPSAVTPAGLFGLPPPPPPSRPKIELTDEQRGALDEVERWHRTGSAPFFSLTGPAGAGKSVLVKEVVARLFGGENSGWWEDELPCAFTAMTGKAALRLSQCTGLGATTLHSILYFPPAPGEDVRFTRLREPAKRLIIVDEASMVSPTIFADLQKWSRLGVRFLLVGDAYQLPPVITGEEARTHGEDYSVFAQVEGARLVTVMRSAGGVLRAATRVRETAEVYRQSDADADGGYEYVESRNPAASAVEAYLSDPDDHMVITWRNEVRMQANRAIRERLGHDGPLPDEGEPVLIKLNGQGHLNGEIVSCGGFETGPVVGSLQTMWMTTGAGARLLVSVSGGRDGEFFDGGKPWVEHWKKYHIDLNKQCLPEPTPVTWGYCLTAHAGQGSEARRATVFLTRGDERSEHFRRPTTLPSGERVPMSARWVYTATTRARKLTTMVVGR